MWIFFVSQSFHLSLICFVGYFGLNDNHPCIWSLIFPHRSRQPYTKESFPNNGCAANYNLFSSIRLQLLYKTSWVTHHLRSWNASTKVMLVWMRSDYTVFQIWISLCMIFSQYICWRSVRGKSEFHLKCHIHCCRALTSCVFRDFAGLRLRMWKLLFHKNRLQSSPDFKHELLFLFSSCIAIALNMTSDILLW